MSNCSSPDGLVEHYITQLTGRKGFETGYSYQLQSSFKFAILFKDVIQNLRRSKLE